MSQDSNTRDGVVGGLVEEAPDFSEARLSLKQEFEVAYPDLLFSHHTC
jgi:hypothetical protein